MIRIANGNSFILASNTSFGVGNISVEGALALAPGLHLFDTSGFSKLGNAL